MPFVLEQIDNNRVLRSLLPSFAILPWPFLKILLSKEFAVQVSFFFYMLNHNSISCSYYSYSAAAAETSNKGKKRGDVPH